MPTIGEAAASRPIKSPMMIPRQHGAWSVLLLGCVLGVAVAGSVGLPTLLVLVALLFSLPARHAATLWARTATGDARRPVLARWTIGYAVAFALPYLALVVAYGRWLLVPLGLIGAGAALAMVLLERRRLDRTLGGEMLGMAGLSLAVPTAAYAASGLMDVRVGALWLLAALVFCGGVLHVRYVSRSRGAASAGKRLREGAPSIGFHLAAVGVMAALGATVAAPALAFVAALPAAARAIWTVLAPSRRNLSIRRLGFEELAFGVVFVVVAAVVFWGAA